tara:strand:+ start:823 stop:996 length:174 start_codon:yes stop_codon:yes gene_type:complete
MAITYKLFKISKNFDAENVIKTDDQGVKSTIPFAQGNVDYEEFLKWKADGGVPEAAD